MTKAAWLRGLFFTGTDTGVGKTFVTACVAGLLRGRGHPCSVSKPVATGAVLRAGVGWVSEDTDRLAQAAGEPDGQRVTPWLFPDPVAPPLAARRLGTALRLADLVAAVRRLGRPGVPVLVEGVGGLLCPLTDRKTVADLAAALALPVVVVARNALGVLNHTLLTLEVAHGRGLSVAGVVLNATAPPAGLADETNEAELRRLGVPLLAVVPYRREPEGDPPAGLAAVDWWELSQRGGDPTTGSLLGRTRST
jgi:dethiobiotin synthetase